MDLCRIHNSGVRNNGVSWNMITYDDKVQSTVNPVPAVNQWRAADANEVKTVVNALQTQVDNFTPDTVLSDWYNVKNHGLTGDGTTIENTAMNALIALAPTNSTIYFPIGTYKFNAEIAIAKKLHFLGSGTGSHLTTAVGNINLFKFNGNTTDYSSFRRFVITNTATTPTTGAAIHVDNAAWMLFEDLYIDNFYNNIFLEDCFWWNINRVLFTGPVNYGLVIDNATPFVDFGDHSIMNSQFIAAHRDGVGGIYHQNSGGFKMVNCKVNQGTHRFDYGYFYDGNAITPDIQISNCSFENFDVSGIRIQTNTFTDTKNITIIGNQLGLSSSAGVLIDINKIQYGTIIGNTLRGNGSGSSIGIRIQNSEGITLLNQYSGFSGGNNFVSTNNTNVTDLSV